MDLDDKQLIDEGRTAYFSSNGNYFNPYKVGSMEFNAYERGWMQALKRDDRRDIRFDSPTLYSKKALFR